MPLLWLLPSSKDARYIAAIAALGLLLIAAGREIVILRNTPPRIVEKIVVETHVVEKKVAGPVVIREKIVTQPSGERIVERIIERAPVTTEKGTDTEKVVDRAVTPAFAGGKLWTFTASSNPRDIKNPSIGLSRSFGIISLGYSHDVGQGAKFDDGHHINLGIPLF